VRVCGRHGGDRGWEHCLLFRKKGKKERERAGAAFFLLQPEGEERRESRSAAFSSLFLEKERKRKKGRRAHPATITSFLIIREKIGILGRKGRRIAFFSLRSRRGGEKEEKGRSGCPPTPFSEKRERRVVILREASHTTSSSSFRVEGGGRGGVRLASLRPVPYPMQEKKKCRSSLPVSPERKKGRGGGKREFFVHVKEEVKSSRPGPCDFPLLLRTKKGGEKGRMVDLLSSITKGSSTSAKKKKSLPSSSSFPSYLPEKGERKNSLAREEG